MSEKSMRRRVVDTLRPLHAICVENAAGPGTPDVNFVEGWIELKHADRWPGVLPLRLPHFTAQQRIWLRRRRLAGGAAYVLLQVEQEWLLFDGLTAVEHLGYLPREGLYSMALRTWRNGLDGAALLTFLKELAADEARP